MANTSIPPKDRPEWEKMITGEIEHSYINYVLQARTYQMRKDIASGRLTIQEAIDELYKLSSKYSLAVQNDFKLIFKTW